MSTRATLGLILCVAPLARAEVLHEKIAVTGLHCIGGVCFAGTPTGHAPVPAAIDQDGELLYKPSGGPQPQPGEPIYGPQPEREVTAGGAAGPPAQGDQPPERRDRIAPDRETGPEGPGGHFYHEVFNPAVFPFKRMTALDAVHLGACADRRPGCQEEQLEVLDRRLRPVEVAGPTRRPERDAFWGSVVIDLEPDKWVPLPSVAADARILSYSAEPPVVLAFAKDGADNLFVSARVGGRHRLTWLTDADARYFGGELPRGVRLADEPAALLHAVPVETRRRARQVLEHAHVRVDAAASLESVLMPLVAYFRAFSVGDLPPSTGNTYLDLALAQKGACRHRSYAFVLTALAIGIPTRYVENELHVYVEVYVPRLGWRRINLGGATLDEQILGAEGKAAHRPRGGDPFPEPEAYRDNGAPAPQAFADAARPRSSAGSGPTSSGRTATASGGSGGAGGGSSGGGGGGGSSGGGGRGDGAMSGAGPSLPYVDLEAVERAAAAEPMARRHPTHVQVALGAAATFRGDAVDVSGRIQCDGGDPAGLPVEIYLKGPGGAVRVGAATSAADGSFHATIEVPRNLPLGNHRVVARTPGDDARAPSR